MVARSKFYPIVYVRGYAGTQGEVEDTVADPYMGFNVGSTKLRQSWDGSVNKHIFESPLVRLMKDYGYTDAYYEGDEFDFSSKVDQKSVWIYRYYEPVSKELGEGKRPEMETYAEGLGEYLRKIRHSVCGANKRKLTNFKVYLVAHSMGGLVVRCWLQNLRAQETNPVEVDKVFTYATPHSGIDFRIIGNIPKYIRINNTENFNEPRMREYLGIKNKKLPVNSLNNKFPESRFFSLIGTNSKDYTVLAGAVRRVVGPMSDGLVQIKNAYADKTPRAFVHRSHSGHYGIVNSEEGYQNLKRFFFGDICINGILKIKHISLPKKIEAARKKAREIKAAYHFEVVTKVRDARWDLYRRTVDESSAIFKRYEDIQDGETEIRLFSSYLSKDEIFKNKERNIGRRNNDEFMGFAINLGLLVPEYVVDKRYFFDDYYAGDYIFNDQLKLLVKADSSATVVKYQWSHQSNDQWVNVVHTGPIENEWLIEIPCLKEGEPGIDASLNLLISPHG